MDQIIADIVKLQKARLPLQLELMDVEERRDDLAGKINGIDSQLDSLHRSFAEMVKRKETANRAVSLTTNQFTP